MVLEFTLLMPACDPVVQKDKRQLHLSDAEIEVLSFDGSCILSFLPHTDHRCRACHRGGKQMHVYP